MAYSPSPFRPPRASSSRAYTGPERGVHARFAVGMAELPYGVAVEIEVEVEIVERASDCSGARNAGAWFSKGLENPLTFESAHYHE